MTKSISLLLFVSLGLSSAQNASIPDEDPVMSFDCDSPCADTEFCGSDLQCHTYSCEVWYELGHPFWTGRQGESSFSSLSCEENMVEDRTFLQSWTLCASKLPLAGEFVAAGPEAYFSSCSDPYNEGQLGSYFMTRKCTARPTNETGFVCYDVSPNTDLEAHTLEYVKQTQGRNGTHHYQLHVASETRVEFRSLGEYGDLSTFNATAAKAAMHSRVFQVHSDMVENICGTGCLLHEFCGNDGACHDIDCDNFFLYGPESVVGRQTDSNFSCSFQLKNSSANPCGSDWPVAVKYECHPAGILFTEVALDVCIDGDDSRHVPFHRMCTATLSPTQEFVCFDMKGVTDLEVFAADYTQSTTESPECTESEMAVSEDDPSWSEYQQGPWVAYHHSTTSGYYGSLYLGSAFQTAPNQPLDLITLEVALLARLVGEAPQSDNEDDPFASAGFSFQHISWSSACFLLTSILFYSG